MNLLAAPVRCSRALAGLLLAVAALGIASFFAVGSPMRRRLDRWFWLLLIGGFGLRVRCHGTPAGAPGTLYVANHVSWTDIAVLGALLETGFVAKDEVSRWPLIGPAARDYGCLFVKREARAAVAGQADALAARLLAGDSLVLFAEGTTGEGDCVLPFRSSLFPRGEGAAAGVVQPVSLVWRRGDGGLFNALARRRFAWIGDDLLLPHAFRLALAGGARVDVHFEQPVPHGHRKRVAQACREAIVARLAGAAPDAVQAATLKRAA